MFITYLLHYITYKYVINNIFINFLKITFSLFKEIYNILIIH